MRSYFTKRCQCVTDENVSYDENVRPYFQLHADTGISINFGRVLQQDEEN